MDAVILFSHGSLLCGAGEALAVHAARLRERGLAPIVEVGYLNYSLPPFPDTVRRCVARGASRIAVVPYFLSPGKFVSTDLPEAVGQARREYPGVQFIVAEAIGYDPLLADAVLAAARTAVPPDRWHDDLRRAGESCRADPQCPLHATPACPLQREGTDE
jgi:sirohydrochlorin cobaltochelatase